MDEIFNFLNSTYEAGHTILAGKGRIEGYAFDGESISGVISPEQGHPVNYSITLSGIQLDRFTLKMKQGNRFSTRRNLTIAEVIEIFKTGDLPIFL
jgi:hypothetical protein